MAVVLQNTPWPLMTIVHTQAAEHRVEHLEAGLSLSAATLQSERQTWLEAERLVQVT